MVDLSSLRATLRPRFTQQAQGADLTIVGTSNYAASSSPVGVVTVGPAGNTSYERLFCDQGPDGTPVAYYYPGTFGALVPAGRGWRG